MFTDAREIITLDGLRVEYADGFGLARPSNTTPVIVLRFEADTAEALQRIQNDFRKIFRLAAPHLQLPFLIMPDSCPASHPIQRIASAKACCL